MSAVFLEVSVTSLKLIYTLIMSSWRLTVSGESGFSPVRKWKVSLSSAVLARSL